jgi:putative transposase
MDGLGYCLMPNHYHLVLETPSEDLSTGMQWLNGRYAQDFNHRHGFDGHLFQGRFYSGQVEGDGHLLELCRYLAWNPVDGGLCRRPQDWRWGSYRSVAGFDRSAAPRFLDARRVRELFGPSPRTAQIRLRTFVDDVRIVHRHDPLWPCLGSDPGRGRSSRCRLRRGSARRGGSRGGQPGGRRR